MTMHRCTPLTQTDRIASFREKFQAQHGPAEYACIFIAGHNALQKMLERMAQIQREKASKKVVQISRRRRAA